MYLFNKRRLKEIRRQLRANETPAEKVLRSELRGRKLDGHRFCRQFSVGPYVLDFYCPREKLAIEVDGRHHYIGDGPARDAERTRYLEHFGIRVLRFRNEEVMGDLEGVLRTIRKALGNTPQPPL